MQTNNVVDVAVVPTKNAASYLRKLCRHWSHRFPVEFNDRHGVIELPQAKCILDAEPATLIVRLELQENTDEARLRKVVEEHLQRFGFQEELVFAWTRTAA